MYRQNTAIFLRLLLFYRTVVLQNCVGLIRHEPDSCGEACVTTLDGQKEEFSIEGDEAEIKVEEADIKLESIGIKEENPEVKKFPPIKTEPEVSVWGLCVRQQQFMFPRPFTATKRELPKILYFWPVRCTFFPKNIT
jgi:hypothetical protein